MRKRKIKTSIYFFLASLFLFGATFFAIIITQGGSVTDQGVSTNTGVLRLNVYPSNVDFQLYIDSDQVTNLVNKGANVEAGVHTIRIEADLFNSWEKRVNITKGIVTDVMARLYPIGLKMEQVTSTNISEMIFSTNGDYLYYIVQSSLIPTERGIWRMQITQNNIFFFNNLNVPIKFAELTTDIEEMLTDPDLLIQPSPDNEKLLFSSPLFNKIYLLTNLTSNNTIKETDIMSELGFYPNSISWLNDSISLLIDDNNTLYEYDLTSKKSILIKYDPSSKIINAHNPSQLLWYDRVKQTLNIYKNQINLELVFPLNNKFPDITNIYIPTATSRYSLIESNDAFFLLDLEKLTITETSLLTDQYTLIDISSEGSTYLFKNIENDLVSFTVEENLAIDELITKTNKFNETLSTIDKVIFTANGSNILIFKPQETSIFSLDPDGTNKINLINQQGITSYFDFDSRSESLYMLVNESSDIDEPQKVSNIYKIDLLLTD